MNNFTQKYRRAERYRKEIEELKSKIVDLEHKNARFCEQTYQLLVSMGMTQQEIFEFYMKANR